MSQMISSVQPLMVAIVNAEKISHVKMLNCEISMMIRFERRRVSVGDQSHNTLQEDEWTFA